MKSQRALTLIEVLASTVLLTMIAATCVPLLRQASEAAREPVRSIDLADLAEFADRLVADADAMETLGGQTQPEVPWPDLPERPPVVITRFDATGGESELNHTWLTFTCDGWSVSRWLAVETEQETQGETDQETTPP